jgi:hypothetical protein
VKRHTEARQKTVALKMQVGNSGCLRRRRRQRNKSECVVKKQVRVEVRGGAPNGNIE